MTISEDLQYLIDVFFQESQLEQKRKDPEAHKIKLNSPLGSVPFIYEKIRGTIDAKEGKFLLRAAIYRIINRKITFKKDPKSIAEGLLKELIWARYFPNDTILKTEIDSLAKILEKYFYIIDNAKIGALEKQSYIEWLVEIAAAEIEDALLPQDARRDKAMYEYMFKTLIDRIRVEDPRYKNLEPEVIQIQTKIIIMRILNKWDFGSVNSALMREFYDGFEEGSPEAINLIAGGLKDLKKTFDYQIRHPFGERLVPYIKRQASVFTIIRDILDTSEDVGIARLKLAESELILEEEVQKSIAIRTMQARQNLKTSTTRSIIYIFITKALVALLVEVQYDLYVVGELHLAALIINIIFPPIVLYLISKSIRFPAEQNTTVLTKDIKEVIDVDILKGDIVIRRPYTGKMKLVFQVFSLITFFISFGGVIWILNQLHFNIVSIFLFIFFTSIVSFFGLRITQNTKELMVVEPRTGLLQFLFDMFSFPLIRAGKFFSSEFSKLNIFIFIMDYIIEAPFKNVVSLAEDWVTFMREKKDEIY